MQRWRGATLAVMLCSGCLEPLSEDNAGYSRHVLPPGAAVASAYADLQVNRKIDMNDGLTGPVVPVKTGFAAGVAVRYWDMGPAKRSVAPAYKIVTCEDDRPIVNDPISHPLIIETIPGDPDYSPFRSISWVCVTPKYEGELFTSIEALEDGLELGLLREPLPAQIWVNAPIVGRGVELSLGASNQPPRTGYYRGTEVLHHGFDDQEGAFAIPTVPPNAGYVYEITRLGFASTVLKVIFSQPFLSDDKKNPLYSPQWILVNVILRSVSAAIPNDMEQEAADIASWDDEGDIVTLTAQGVPTPKMGTRVLAATVTQTRLNRPFVVRGVSQ